MCMLCHIIITTAHTVIEHRKNDSKELFSDFVWSTLLLLHMIMGIINSYIAIIFKSSISSGQHRAHNNFLDEDSISMAMITEGILELNYQTAPCILM